MIPTLADYAAFTSHVDCLPHLYQTERLQGTIRQEHSDFEVTEKLTFEPCGEGEHLFLYIEKNNCNTQWVADELQKHFKLRSQDVGYAGKKDRYSVSRQWFSLHLPGKNKQVSEAFISNLDNLNYRILEVKKHNKKLRKGVIKHNHFKILVNQVAGEIDQAILASVKTQGFPNYFGYQRFGFNGNNLVQADLLLRNKIRVRSRNKKGLYLSSARSYLFNLMVAERINQNKWNTILVGDCLSLAGSQSYFCCEQLDDEIISRFNAGDLHVSGWLAGARMSEASGQALVLETKALANQADWLQALVKAGVNSARRPIRVIPDLLQVRRLDIGQYEFEFKLPSGCFATSLLREFFIINDAALLKTNSQNNEVALIKCQNQ